MPQTIEFNALKPIKSVSAIDDDVNFVCGIKFMDKDREEVYSYNSSNY